MKAKNLQDVQFLVNTLARITGVVLCYLVFQIGTFVDSATSTKVFEETSQNRIIIGLEGFSKSEKGRSIIGLLTRSSYR